jgi:NAD(P)-dependent dehydrogenase (short-subunit alcohol dehydrogenase family)
MQEVRSLFDAVSAITSVVDILFVNAGVAHFVPFAETTEELFDANMDINFKGVFFTIQRLLPLLSEQSAIILNASIVAHSGMEGSTAYSASKAAILSFGKTLAVELAGRSIRVNVISPGPINTPLYSKLGMPEDAFQQFAAGVQAKVPMKRFGAAEDVAKAALFLSTAESGFITGAELVVDGGISISF